MVTLRACIFSLVLIIGVAGSTIRYETEDSHIIGNAFSSNVHKGYSGSGFVNFAPYEAEETISTVIFTVNIPEDNKYLITFGYATEGGVVDASGLAVYINGLKQQDSMLPPSAGKWATKAEAALFRQGLNSIVLKGITAASFRVDFVEIEGAIPLAPRGATLPYYEIEAEAANHNGQRIGPSRALYQLPTEASGRLAVQINQGQYVEFTLTAPANALSVRFSIPDTSDGAGQVASLDVYVDGAKSLTLTVTSKNSWAYGSYPFTKNPNQGNAHHFYDEARGMFGKTLAKGAKVRVVAVNPITYTIDLADFYTAPAPYTMPSGYISIADNGADPSGQKDSTGAFNATIKAAAAAGKGVWIPQGTFAVTSRFTLNKITVRGAGPWYSVVKATVNHGVGFFGGFNPNPSSNVQLFDFAVVGATNVRDDDAADSGVGGALTGNSMVQNLWIEHTKCGMWLDGPFDGFHVTATIIRNTYADGINFHMGITNSIVEQSILRNLGDDGLAVWSEKITDSKIVFKSNTIQVPLLANGIALYGGQDNSVTDNYVADTICDGGGLQVGNRYNSIGVAGTTTFARNTVVRCGAPSRFSPSQDCGSIWVFQEQGSFSGTVTISATDSIDSSNAAVTFWNGNYNGNVVISGMNVVGGPYVMEVNSASGTVPCTNVVAKNLTLNNGGIHSCAGLIFQDNGGNAGWDMNHDHQHCN